MKYAIKVLIIGLMFWTFNTVKVMADLKTAYVAYPGYNPEATAVSSSVLHYDKDSLKVLIDFVDSLKVLIDFVDSGNITGGTEFYHDMLISGLSVIVQEGFNPVHNCEQYKTYTICEIVR